MSVTPLSTGRKIGAVVAAMALSVAAVACGDDDDDSGGDDTAGTAAEDAPADTGDSGDGADETDGSDDGSASTEVADAANDGEIDPDGVLTVATFGVGEWDPDTVSSSFSIILLGLVFDRLVHTAPDGSLVPGLATEWEYDDDSTTLTFTLREGVVFQDGEPFDADAVKANLDRSLTLEGSAHVSDLARVEEVVVVDPTTVELHLSAADATLPAVLSGAAGAMMSPASMDDPQVDQNPVGAGMYELVDFTPGASFGVERWDGYWDPDAVQSQRIEFTALPDAAARVNALKTGAVDIAPLEPTNVEEVQSSDGVSVRLNDTLRYVYLAMNLGIEPVDDLLVRQAIMHAIDRQSLLDGLYLGYGAVTEQPWPEGYFPHVDGLDDTYPYDLDRARELLAEAGIPDGFSADIIAVPAPAVYAQLGEAVQAQLAEIGIDLTVQITEPAELGTAMYVDKTAEFALLYTNGSVDPAITVGTRYSADGFFNPGGYSTPTLEELYTQSIATTDDAARTEVMQGISTEVVEQVLDMPIFFAQEPEGISDRVVGYESYVTGKPEFRGVGVIAG